MSWGGEAGPPSGALHACLLVDHLSQLLLMVMDMSPFVCVNSGVCQALLSHSAS